MTIQKVLIVRNDKIGDLVLAFPAIKALKLSCPDIEISVLVSAYTKELAEMMPYLDKVIVDSSKKSAKALGEKLKEEQFDAVICLYSTFHVAWACFVARIKIRIVPASKIFQFLFNYRIKQRRSLSLQPEFEYNKDLVRFFIYHFMEGKVAKTKPPYLTFNKKRSHALRTDILQKNNLADNISLIFIHPGSGGSAKNLSKEQYAALAKQLHFVDKTFIVLTAGPGELALVKTISEHLPMTPHIIHHAQDGLSAFVDFIAIADIFIAGSTGPLHIAGALNRKTVGFYPNRRSATSLRWQTINEHFNQLSFSPPGNADEEDMEAIDVDDVAKKITHSWPELF